jgi:hypothetical protein
MRFAASALIPSDAAQINAGADAALPASGTSTAAKQTSVAALN